MKKASLIAFISVAIMALIQVSNIICNIIEYSDYMDSIGWIAQLLYLLSYCGVAYFFFKLYRMQR